MKILILGGTRFLGRHLATEVLRREHALTLYDPERESAFGEVAEEIVEDLAELGEHRWDACIDTTTRNADEVTALATKLKDRVGRYIYISSIDVHVHDSVSCRTGPEGRALCGHGARKAESEAVLESVLGDRLTIVRPGLLIGPHDQSGRFAYWATRVLDGGEILAPGPRDAALQIVDVRDVANFTVAIAEQQLEGKFDVVGPEQSTTFGEFLDRLGEVAGDWGSITWVDNGFLLEHDVEPWNHIPMWLTEEGPRSVVSIDGHAALEAGFAPRTTVETLTDTLAWFRATDRVDESEGDFLDRSRERELLSAWHRIESLARQPLAAGHEI